MTDSLDETAALRLSPTAMFIGGEWRESATGSVFQVLDPATGVRLCDVPDGSTADALDALSAAWRVQQDWAARPSRERAEILRSAFEIVTRRSEEFALLMTMEMGKPLAEARAEVAYAADFLRWFSEEAVRVAGDFGRAPNGRGRILTTPMPVGPCLLVTPWNFPLAMGARKIAPAIAAGCTMVVKPAEDTPLSTLALAKILEEAGLPAGVLNVVTTSRPAEVVGPLLADGRIRKLSFTGSTEVGRLLMAQCAPRLVRVSLELGGNAPFLVFDDADLGAAVDGAVIAKMRNIGEACTAANRFHVSRRIAEEFSGRLAERLGAMRVGRGTEAGVEVGPLINEPAREKVAELVGDARARGATVLLGGGGLEGPGYFYQPTVLTDVPRTARLFEEEIFGPVAPIAVFDSEDEAVDAANDTEYGLVAYVFTRNLSRALRVVDRLETGMVGLNQGLVSNAAAPFGGVKQSGIGREGGSAGIEEYLATKYVAVAD